MAERLPHRRARTVAAWVVTAALVGGYFLTDEADLEDRWAAPAPAPFVCEPDGKGRINLEVLGVDQAEPTPGSAITVRFACANPKNPALVGARLSASAVEDSKRELQVLHRSDDQIVVKIPGDAVLGKSKLRLQQGDDKELRSKPYDLMVKPVNRRKLFRNVVGGLALLVFGLYTLSTGSRSYTGHRSQGILARIGRRTPAAVGLGVVAGGVTQFTTSAAGLVIGLIQSHLLAVGPAVAVLLGAQLGAAALPALFVSFSTEREGLLVVTLGVIWLLIADDRRSKALAKIILGCGLLFYGLYLLRQGFQSLVSNPELLPYIDRLDASTIGGTLACALAGALLAALLQGPAPVYVLVLGLASASGRIDLQSALAILAGTPLGSAIGVTVVAWPFGREPRRLAQYNFLLALAGTAFLLATVDAWAYLADMLVSGHPHEAAFGKKVLLRKFGDHLVTGFALSQVTVTLVLAAALPLVLRLGRRIEPLAAALAPPLEGAEGVKALRQGLERVLALHRNALEAVLDLCLSGHRAQGMRAEHALADARAEIETLFSGAVRSRGDDADLARLRQAALATLQLQRAVEDLLRHAERTTERAMALSPEGEGWQLAPSDAATLRALHTLVIEGLDAATAQVRGEAAPDADDARSREIRLNAMEMETRQALLADADRGEPQRAIALRLGSTDLVNAYEGVGNHLYRLHEAMASEIEQDVAHAI